MRIALGGISHESNTFSSLKTTLADFTIRRSEECVQGEFWEALRSEGVDLAPTLTAGATPNGPVREEAYLAMKEELLDRLRAVLPVDGVYLSLHGAMEVENIGDGETDLAGAVRSLVGPDVPISVSLDLHGNLSPEFVGSCNVFTALRTAPHVDGLETRARAVGHLMRCIREGKRPVTAMVKLPLLLPGENAVTAMEPSLSLYGMIPGIESIPGIWDASLMIACAWTDSPYTSVSTLVAGDDLKDAQEQAQKFADAVWARRAEFGPEVETVSIEESIRRAMASSKGTYFISDSGDNVTAGGAGDIPLFVERLLAANAQEVLVAAVVDHAAVAACASSGVGNVVELSLGGKIDQLNAKPLALAGKVLKAEPTLAVVQVQGVTVVIIDGRRPFHTLLSFQQTGIHPFAKKIIVVKQGYLAPELREHCSGTVMALTPGFTDLRIESLPYRRIRRPIYPLDAM